MGLGQDNRREDEYQALMLAYASGALDEAETLIVSAHINLSEKGQKAASFYEAMGGVTLEKFCEPVQMSKGSMQYVMDRLDALDQEAQDKKALDCDCAILKDLSIPDCLSAAVMGQKKPPSWKKYLPGVEGFELKMGCKRSNSKARFMRFEPAYTSPHHSHAGREITLVLDGAFDDETGRYGRGDLLVIDNEEQHHTPKACPENGCVCMVVTNAPIRLKGIASLLNPFLGK